MQVTKDDLVLSCRNPEGEAGKQTILRMNESHASLTDWGLSHVEIRPADDVLDVGCGGGAALKKIALRNPEGRCYGVDISDLSIAEAEKLNAESVDEGRMSFQRSGVSKLPFADASMDLVFSVESYYFWPDSANDLKEIFRTLKKGGHLLIVLEYRADMEKDEDYLHNQELLHMHVPDSETLTDEFEAAGFSGVSSEIKDDWLCTVGEK